MADRDVRIRIVSQDQASAQLKRVGASVTEMAAAFVAAQASIAGVTAIFQKLAGTMRQAVELASIQEESERKLEQAFKAAGIASASAVDAAKSYAAELQQQSRYGDEAIMVAQRYLVTLGGLTGEGLNRATKATIDLAEAIDVDLKSAAMLLAKAAAGSTEALSRYGIILDESIPKEERFNAVLEQIEQKMGGSAAAAADTYAGTVDQLSNAFGDLLEELGKTVTKNEAVKKSMKEATGIFSNLSWSIQHARDGYSSLEKASFVARRLFEEGLVPAESYDLVRKIIAAYLDLGDSEQQVYDMLHRQLTRHKEDVKEYIEVLAHARDVMPKRLYGAISDEAERIAKALPKATEAMREWEAVAFRKDYQEDEWTPTNVSEDMMAEAIERYSLFDELVQETVATANKGFSVWHRQIKLVNVDMKDTGQVLKDVQSQLIETESIGTQVAQIIGNAFAAQFARLIVEGGKLKRLMQDLLRLAIQIAIELGIRTALKAAFPAMFASGGTVPAHAAAGLVVGPDLTVDTIPVLLSPGEVVLSRQEAERYRSQGEPAAPAVNLSVSVIADRRRLAETLARDISDLVRRRGGMLVASEVS